MGKKDETHKRCDYCKKSILDCKASNRKYYYDMDYGLNLKFHKQCWVNVKKFARRKRISISKAVRLTFLFVGYGKIMKREANNGMQ